MTNQERKQLTGILHTFSHSLSNKLELREKNDKGGFGVYVLSPIKKGEVLVVWGGKVVTVQELSRASATQQRHSIQVDEDHYLIPHNQSEVGDFINHSCNPNSGIKGQVTLVAIRDITPGEEVCYDYAMTDASDYDEFECACGALECRKKVSGLDWQLLSIQKKYDRYFSTYIQQKIKLFKKSLYSRRRSKMTVVAFQ